MPAEDVNHWFDDRCAKIYWDQHKAQPYQQLLHDTVNWLEPKKGQRWLDLGCGGGQLTAALWGKSKGGLAQVVAADCAAVNAENIDRLRERYSPADPEQMVFRTCDFSQGLPQFDTASFDGIVSGLALCYAEWKDPITGRYTDYAYNRLLSELYRVLKPGGQLVFSVPVPKPRFWKILWKSLRKGWRVSKPGRALLNGLKMQRYGRWLHREADRGRFHYYSVENIAQRLSQVGFLGFRYRFSFAEQAYLISVQRPTATAVRAA